ncbi:MAG: methyltransferase domain-containing protein [Ginsengibacter sp.]
MNIDYNPHLLEWNDEKVERFWHFYNNYEDYSGTWFAEVAGGAILKFVNKKFGLHGKILDYGTGKGFLLQHILNKYPLTELYACDFTESLANETNLKFKSNPNFKECMHLKSLPSDYAENTFDFVFLIETIEHLTNNYLEATLLEINRILKPGGIIVITTPDEEIIEKNYVHCADCGATFHQMQHVRSWNAQKLRSITEKFYFKSKFCKAINLMWFQENGFYYYSIARLKNIFGKKFTPNLMYIGKKAIS